MKTRNRRLLNSRRGWLALVALGLLLHVLPGCGGGNEAPTENQAQATGAPEADPPAPTDEGKPSRVKPPTVAQVAQEMVEKTQGESMEEAAGMSRTDALIAALTIFVLAIFVGFELITKVPPTLHTPLMSGSNAISGVTLVGAVLMAGNGISGWAAFFGLLAVIMASINAVGGFMVTDRMLEMFQRK